MRSWLAYSGLHAPISRSRISTWCLMEPILEQKHSALSGSHRRSQLLTSFSQPIAHTGNLEAILWCLPVLSHFYPAQQLQTSFPDTLPLSTPSQLWTPSIKRLSQSKRCSSFLYHDWKGHTRAKHFYNLHLYSVFSPVSLDSQKTKCSAFVYIEDISSTAWP